MKAPFGMPQAEIARLEQSLFFEQPQFRARMIRFVMLIFFASVIASGGLISDSPASVIGAMIVAPLMTPIMGMVVALVIGSRPRFVRSFVIVLAGVMLAIAIGWLVAEIMPGGWDPTLSGQVTSRTSPRLLDLVIALASGGAGAYALSRVDVADALPGVAIAVSLVPPLCTAGILIAGGHGELAKGATLLFVTNFAAILLAGTVTFVATGLATGVGRSRRDLRKALVAILAMVLVISIPLRVNSRALWTETRLEEQTLSAAQDWLTPSGFEVIQIDVDGNTISLVLVGSGELLPAEPLIAQIDAITGGEMVVTARILEVRKETISATPHP